MSQMRTIGVELRAIIAVVAACALAFSLLVSGAVTGANGSAHASGASKGGSAALACYHSRQDARVFGAAPVKPSGGQSGHIHCPDCCLATQISSAVLPERLATIARPTPASAERAPYSAISAHEPDTDDSNAVNGARAPPELPSLS